MKKKRFLTLAASLFVAWGAWAALPQDDAGYYLIGSPADLVEFSSFVNAGNHGANGRLTADIDMSSVENFTPIGLYSDGNKGGSYINHSYGGTFDGQGHVIKNLTIKVDYDLEVAFISRVGGGTVKNLSLIDVTVQNTSQNPRTGAIAGLLHNGRISNVFVSALEVSASASGETGNLVGTNVGGTITNCLTDSAPLVGSPQSGSITNSYTYNDLDSDPRTETGEICFSLNGDQQYAVFRQNIGIDTYPTGDPSHPIVYIEEMTCDGKAIDGGYTNTNTRPDHEFEDGICKTCSTGFQENYVPKTDGVFQIGSADQLVWFSRYVNAGNTYAKAVLTKDIDMEGVYSMQAIGSFADETWRNQFGALDIKWSGTFDGQGHIIKNLFVRQDDYYETGLFSRTNNAVIQNLGIVNATIINTKSIRAGVLGGEILNTTVRNVFTTGDITITTDHAQKGGLAGEASGGRFFNCYSTYDNIEGNTLGSKNNCYSGAAAQNGLATGELCFNLNGDQSSIIYYQTLEQDAYPVLDNTHSQVYAAGEVRCDGQVMSDEGFSNTPSVIPEHQYDNVGLCTVCGHDIGTVPRASDMWLEVATGEQLRYAMRVCNYKNEQGVKDPGLCFRIIADIDMTGIEGMEPFGLFADTQFQTEYGLMDNSYSGICDGMGHEISNLNIVMDNYYETGLFSRMTGTVRNLGIVNAYIENTKGIRTGVIAGEMTGTLNNVYTTGDISVVTTHAQKGGLAAECYSGTLNNCYTTYEKIRTDLGTLNNCYEGADAAAQAPTGELAYKLNQGNIENPTWFQTLGKEDHPRLLGEDIVYNVENFGYSNINAEMARPELVDGVYQITNGQELIGFAVIANSEPDADAQVMNNIDMTGLAYVPIATDAIYTGTFNGRGSAISNLVMGTASEPVDGPCALFANVGAGATIKNLTLTGDCSFNGGNYTAGVISNVKGETEGTLTIQNVVNSAEVSGVNRVAGVLAYAECTADAPLTIVMNEVWNAGNISGAQQVGGILGLAKVAKVEINECYNQGAITSSAYHVGGIVGRTEKIADYENPQLIIKNSHNYGNVTAERTSVAGICGVGLTTNTIENCVNTGTIQGSGCVAGIMGNSCATITGCYNTGTIIGTGAYGELKIGGIIGNSGGSFVMTDCFNEGKIEGRAGTIEESKKQADGNAGGVVGVATDAFTLTNCYNVGEVIGFGNNCGGVVGRLSAGKEFTIKDCWNTGDVTSGFGENAGGIIGGAQGSPTPHILNCYNTGKIAGNTNSAAIAGWLGNNNPAEVKNCWNIGEIVHNSGNNTMYRRGNSGEFTRVNNYDLSGTVAEPSTALPPSGYTDEWLANGNFTYFINQGAGAFIYRQNIGEDETPVLLKDHAYVAQISESGYGTFSVAEEAVAVPTGVTAYSGVQNGSIVTLTAIEGAIPAATGVVLKGEAGFYSFQATDEEAPAIAENDLIATSEPFTANGLQYVLATVEGATGFYQVVPEDIIPFAKAFIVPRATAEGGVKSLSIVFGDATGIDMATDAVESGASIYDLSGRRVEKAQKGIYIINGKKVLK